MLDMFARPEHRPLRDHQAKAIDLLRQSLARDGEVFAEVKGFDRYLVSNHGRVYSTVRAGRFLRPTILNTGYEYVSLMADGSGKGSKQLVHRLVATAFCSGSGECVNHIDGDKRNNHAENLEWCSYGHNNDHARDAGLSTAYSETHYAAKLRNADIPVILARAAAGELHKNIAADFGVNRQSITKIVGGKAWRRAAHA